MAPGPSRGAVELRHPLCAAGDRTSDHGLHSIHDLNDHGAGRAMTQWGALLLCGYIALGTTSRLSRRRAGQIALLLTVAVVGVSMVRYMHTTPTDKYYKDVDATVYATGQPAAALDPNTSTTENVTGVQPATPGNTVGTSVAAGDGS
jgi:hypothetical protein